MGKKYASIHIYAEKQTKIITDLKKYYKVDDNIEPRMKAAANIFANEEARNMFTRFTQLYVNEVLVIQSDTFVSIYDETLSFETVEDKSKIFSFMFDYPIVYVSNFDDDVLIFGIYRSGNLITQRNLGQGLSMYEIPYASLNIASFRSELTIASTDIMEAINKSEIIDSVENEISKVLNVPLNIRKNDIQLMDGIFEEKKSNNGMLLYKLIK